MIILVCGGRDYKDKTKMKEVLDKYNITCIIHGACKGADLLAEEYAKVNEIDYKGYPAKWKLYGRSAGYIRNTKMLNDPTNSIDLVLAFPGGRGTKNMIDLAKSKQIKVIEIK